MLTKKFIGERPRSKTSIITGTVLGKDGKPMSKIEDNGVDPIEMFDKFGVDATRIYLARSRPVPISNGTTRGRNLSQFRQQDLERHAVLSDEFRGSVGRSITRV